MRENQRFCKAGGIARRLLRYYSKDTRQLVCVLRPISNLSILKPGYCECFSSGGIHVRRITGLCGFHALDMGMVFFRSHGYLDYYCRLVLLRDFFTRLLRQRAQICSSQMVKHIVLQTGRKVIYCGPNWLILSERRSRGSSGGLEFMMCCVNRRKGGKNLCQKGKR